LWNADVFRIEFGGPVHAARDRTTSQLVPKTASSTRMRSSMREMQSDKVDLTGRLLEDQAGSRLLVSLARESRQILEAWTHDDCRKRSAAGPWWRTLVIRHGPWWLLPSAPASAPSCSLQTLRFGRQGPISGRGSARLATQRHGKHGTSSPGPRPSRPDPLSSNSMTGVSNTTTRAR